MSLKAWVDKYYPRRAKKYGTDRKSQLFMLREALKKWEGLREDVLEKYGLQRYYNDIEGGGYGVFSVCDETCSLCRSFSMSHEHGWCDGCPITSRRGAKGVVRAGCGASFSAFVDHGNPEPMIKRLKWAIAQLSRAKKK